MKIMQLNRLWRISSHIDQYMFDLTNLLEKQGHEVIPFAVQDPGNQPSAYSSLFVSPLELINPFRTPFWKLAGTASRIIYSREAANRVSVLADLTHPDVAHIQKIYVHISPSVLPPLAKRGVGIVMTVHDHKLFCPSHLAFRDGSACYHCRPYHYGGCFIGKCVQESHRASILSAIELLAYDLFHAYTDNVDCFIAPSLYMADRLLARGIPQEKVAIIPFFVDADEWPVADFDGGDYVFFSGQLLPLEGINTLIEAFAGLPDIPLKIAGTGMRDHQARELAWELGADNIEFLGYSPEKDIEQLLNGCRFICMPLESPVNVPTLLLKAFATGRPVIASRLGGLPEAVREGKTGKLVIPGDVDGLREAVRALWQDAAHCREMGREARRIVEEEYSPQSHYEKMIDVYQAVKKT